LSIKLLILCLLTGTLFGATIPDDIKKAVVFIYKEAESPTQFRPDGTGFLVSVPNPVQPGTGWLYLITAKHVLHTDPNNVSSPLYQRLFVRLNKRSGDAEMFQVSIITSGVGQTVFLHVDGTVDIAVIPIAVPDPKLYDLKVIPEGWLATSDDIAKNHIGVGTDVFFIGMFTPYLGQRKSYPIVRFGKVAMLPTEKVSFAGADIEAYLVETFAFGGNSGSPVFFYLGSDRDTGSIFVGPPIIKVAGVMKGSFNDVEPVKAAQVASTGNQIVPVSIANAGIAVVVPAEKVEDILHSAALESRRH
jgi:hypothetical protein